MVANIPSGRKALMKLRARRGARQVQESGELSILDFQPRCRESSPGAASFATMRDVIHAR
jgi:hypothetical protein